jgi:hypothetical protein
MEFVVKALTLYYCKTNFFLNLENQRPSATPRVNAPNVMRLVREMLGDIATTSEDFQVFILVHGHQLKLMF